MPKAVANSTTMPSPWCFCFERVPVCLCVCVCLCVLDKDASFLLLAWHFEKCSQRVARTLSVASFYWAPKRKPAAFEVCVCLPMLHDCTCSYTPSSPSRTPTPHVLTAHTALGNNLKCKIMRKAGAVRQTQDGCHLLTDIRVALVVLVVVGT